MRLERYYLDDVMPLLCQEQKEKKKEKKKELIRTIFEERKIKRKTASHYYVRHAIYYRPCAILHKIIDQTCKSKMSFLFKKKTKTNEEKTFYYRKQMKNVFTMVFATIPN